MTKMYVKSDGNGGITMSKGLIALVTLLLIVSTTFASVVAFSVGVRGDVDINREKVSECQQGIDGLHGRVGENEKDIRETQTQITDMKDDLAEIKSDIKQLLKQGGN